MKMDVELQRELILLTDVRRERTHRFMYIGNLSHVPFLVCVRSSNGTQPDTFAHLKGRAS